MTSVIKKLKKIRKTRDKAKGKLIRLVSGQAKKKKILKQVDEIQDLEKQQRKLEKKAKTLKDRTPKAKKQEHNKSKSLSVSPSEKTGHEPVVAAEKLEESPASLLVSRDMTVVEAIQQMGSMSTMAEIRQFVNGDTRKTIGAEAERRISRCEA